MSMQNGVSASCKTVATDQTSSVLLWLVAWLLHLPKPVIMLMNEMNGPFLGVLYRHDNLLPILILLSFASSLLISYCLYFTLKKYGYQPFKQPLFWIFGVAIFLLPVFSAMGAMLWLKGKQLSSRLSLRTKTAISLGATAIFLLIVSWMFWVNGVSSFQGYVLRSVLKEKVSVAEQALLRAIAADQQKDTKTARQEIALSRKLLQEVASYRYPCCEEKINKIRESLMQVEQSLLRDK